MLASRKSFIYLHEHVLLVGTCSGPGACIQEDWSRPVSKYEIDDVSDADLGQSVRRALEHCRETSLVEYEEILRAHMSLMNVDSAEKLYANTKSIDIVEKNHEFSIKATKQHGIGGFKGISGVEVRIAANTSDQELGRAVKSMLDRSVA